MLSARTKPWGTGAETPHTHFGSSLTFWDPIYLDGPVVWIKTLKHVLRIAVLLQGPLTTFQP